MSLKEKARAGRLSALNIAVTRRDAIMSGKVEILHRKFPVKRVSTPVFTSCRAAFPANMAAA